MNKLATLLLAAAMPAILANPVFAATTTGPTAPLEPKPSATSGPSPAPEATAAPAPAATTQTPVPPAAAASAPASATAGAAAGEAPVKIGYVDMVKMGMESKRGKAAAAAIKAKSDKLKSKIQAKERQLEKQKAKIEAMPPEERPAKIKDFQKRVEEYQRLVRSSGEEVQKLEEKLTVEVYEAIKKAATSYGKANGYTAIVERKGVLYTTESVKPTDLTEEISGLMDRHPAK